jgi:hypothetical protein
MLSRRIVYTILIVGRASRQPEGVHPIYRIVCDN